MKLAKFFLIVTLAAHAAPVAFADDPNTAQQCADAQTAYKNCQKNGQSNCVAPPSVCIMDMSGSQPMTDPMQYFKTDPDLQKSFQPSQEQINQAGSQNNLCPGNAPGVPCKLSKDNINSNVATNAQAKKEACLNMQEPSASATKAEKDAYNECAAFAVYDKSYNKPLPADREMLPEADQVAKDTGRNATPQQQATNSLLRQYQGCTQATTAAVFDKNWCHVFNPQRPVTCNSSQIYGVSGGTTYSCQETANIPLDASCSLGQMVKIDSESIYACKKINATKTSYNCTINASPSCAVVDNGSSIDTLTTTSPLWFTEINTLSKGYWKIHIAWQRWSSYTKNAYGIYTVISDGTIDFTVDANASNKSIKISPAYNWDGSPSNISYLLDGTTIQSSDQPITLATGKHKLRMNFQAFGDYATFRNSGENGIPLPVVYIEIIAQTISCEFTDNTKSCADRGVASP